MFFVTLLKHYVIVHENTNIVIPIFTLYEVRESLYALLNEASLERHFFLAMSASVSATCMIVHKNWYYTRKHIG